MNPARFFFLASVLLSTVNPVEAQETPTEIVAARSVVADRVTMETSLNVPALVDKLTAPNVARDKVVARAKQLMDTELLAMADDITRHPEIGFEERRTSKILVDYLTAHGFKVTMPVAGLETAFIARYDGAVKGPVMGVLLEYDALRGTSGPFHGDQHSAQGPISIAVAVAMAEHLTASHTPGSIVAYGTPAEEMMPVVKTIMFKAHVFDGLDVMVRSHSAP